MKQFLLVPLLFGVFLWADFIKSDNESITIPTKNDSNNIIIDNTTRLQWQSGIGKSMVWDIAKTYCKDLNVDGSGWRLPSINELKTIKDNSEIVLSMVNDISQRSSYGYWTSAPVGLGKDDTWGVYLYYDFDYWDTKKSSCYVRCVREEKISPMKEGTLKRAPLKIPHQTSTKPTIR